GATTKPTNSSPPPSANTACPTTAGWSPTSTSSKWTRAAGIPISGATPGGDFPRRGGGQAFAQAQQAALGLFRFRRLSLQVPGPDVVAQADQAGRHVVLPAADFPDQSLPADDFGLSRLPPGGIGGFRRQRHRPQASDPEIPHL